MIERCEKFGQMFLAIALFVAVVAVILLRRRPVRASAATGSSGHVRRARPVIWRSACSTRPPHHLRVVQGRRRQSFVGFDNYSDLHRPDQLIVLRNTAIWVLITPFVATAIGLIYAMLVDKAGRVVRQGADLPADGDLVGRRVDHLEVRLRLPARRRPHADRPAQPDPGLARLRTAAVPAHRPLEHPLPDRHHDLDPGRFRDDGAVGGDQGDPGRHRRGGPPRRRVGLRHVPLHHGAEHPADADRRAHHDRASRR